MKNLITPTQLSDMLSDDKLIILDASQEGTAAGLSTEYPDDKIKGARFFDIKNKFSNTESGLPNTFPSKGQFEEECQKLGINNDSTIVVYDNIGLFSSPRVWWMFQTMGHQNIKVLDGGLPGWIKEGLLTVKKGNEDSYTKGNFIAHLNPSKIRFKIDVLKNIESAVETVVDARGKQRFDGTIEEPRPGMKSGHIPNSINLPFKEVLNNGFIKSDTELREIFSQKVAEDKSLVFTCGSGITACILHLAASEVLDTPMAIYDGSWSEWGTSECPVVKS